MLINPYLEKKIQYLISIMKKLQIIPSIVKKIILLKSIKMISI